MAKPTEPKKAAKKDKIPKEKKAGLSEHRVVDSDSEGETKKTSKSPAKSKPAEKAIKKTKERKKEKKAATPPPAKKEESSEEDEEEDSDDLVSDDESTASESDKAVEKEKSNGLKKRKADSADSSSGEESSSGEDLKEIQKPAAKKAKTQAQPKKAAATSPPPASSVQPAAVPTPSIPAGTFTAPKNFTPIEPSKTPSASLGNLAGKQIWHITAPTSLPISSIETVALDAISIGSTVLTHKGSSYTLTQDTSASNTGYSVFVPGKDGYKASEKPVEKTLRLQQKIELPQLGDKQARTETGGEVAAAAVAKAVGGTGEGPRPQPKGMRMRYKPPGFGLGDAGLGSDDDEEVESGFRLPGGKKAKKARRQSGDAMEGVEATGKELSKEERKKAKKDARAKAAAGSQ